MGRGRGGKVGVRPRRRADAGARGRRPQRLLQRRLARAIRAIVEGGQRASSESEAGATLHVDLLHRAVPIVRTAAGLRAVSNDRPISSDSVERYLEGKFGDNLEPVRRAMVNLAQSMPTDEIAVRAYNLYEEFRPAVPAGVRGWGAAGELDLDLIDRLSRTIASGS